MTTNNSSFHDVAKQLVPRYNFNELRPLQNFGWIKVNSLDNIRRPSCVLVCLQLLGSFWNLSTRQLLLCQAQVYLIKWKNLGLWHTENKSTQNKTAQNKTKIENDVSVKLSWSSLFIQLLVQIWWNEKKKVLMI